MPSERVHNGAVRARVVVTGGAGFIGHHLVRALEDAGHRVLVIDDLSGASSGGLRAETLVERLDIASDDIASPIAGWRPSIVYHLAAQVSVPRSMEDPGRDLEVNVVGTRRVLEAAKAAGASRFVFVSSGGAIYGETSSPATEETPPAPMSYYGAHKLLAEHYVRLSGIPYAIARPSNIYGPGQPAGGEGAVIAAFVAAGLSSSPLAIHGDGTQRRDFLHVADLVAALMLLGEHRHQGTWNVSYGADTSVLEVAGLIQGLVPLLMIAHGGRRSGDVNASRLASESIRRLGWTPHVSLSDGLRRLLSGIA